MGNRKVLIADVGGTNARFALSDADGSIADARNYVCADFRQADLAIRDYLDSAGIKTPAAICIAAAGPVIDQAVSFTNNAWTLSGAALSEAFGDVPVAILNDFEAVAFALPQLAADDSIPIGVLTDPPHLNRNFTIAAIGPGTGLGHSILVRRGETTQAIMSESGHTGFAPESPRQMEFMPLLMEKFGRVSNERLVSGPGIENLYWALSTLKGEAPRGIRAADIFRAGLDGKDETATETVQEFFKIFGQVAGDFALSVMATDGVFIAGGIIQRYAAEFARSRFRDGFESKGVYRPLMQKIPTRLITHDAAGLLGASAYAKNLVSG